MSKKAILWNPEDRRIDNQKIVLAENVAYGFRPEEIRKFQFKCCGQIKGERCLADLELVCLDSDNIEPYFRQKKGTGVKTHKKGCPFDETADSRIITAVSRNLSGTDLEAICKGLERGKAVRNSTSDEDSTGGEKSSDPSEEAERDDVGIPEKRYNPAKKLHEVFLLSLTHLENEMFKNKQMVGDHVLNSFTYESFRSGERKLDGYSLVPAERFMDRDIMDAIRAKYKRVKWVMKDPYYSDKAGEELFFGFEFEPSKMSNSIIRGSFWTEIEKAERESEAEAKAEAAKKLGNVEQMNKVEIAKEKKASWNEYKKLFLVLCEWKDEGKVDGKYRLAIGTLRSSKQTELLVPVFVQQERKDYLNSDYDNYFEDE